MEIRSRKVPISAARHLVLGEFFGQTAFFVKCAPAVCEFFIGEHRHMCKLASGGGSGEVGTLVAAEGLGAHLSRTADLAPDL